MDHLMWIITFVALTLALGMSVVAVHLLRGDRRRTAARVAALEAAALEADEYELDADGALDLDEARTGFDEFRDRDAAMFAATNEPAAPSRRWIAFAAVAIIMAGLMGAAYVLFKPAALDAPPALDASPAATQNLGTRTPEPEPRNQNPGTSEPRNPGTLPIELLSLKHTIDGATFMLAGLVQNPIGGAPFTHVVAVVYLFDKDGAYFATGRADLEFRGLRPGEESPFTVRIPVVARVGRYRVGFRRDDGSVIPHADKRGQRTAGMMTEGQD